MSKVNAIPEGFHTVTPFLVVKDADKTFEFYEKGLGAKRKYVKKTRDGTVMHAEFTIGDSPMMFSEEMPEYGSKAPGDDKLKTSAIWLYTQNVDEMYKKALEAGAVSKQEPADAFWGDRLASVIDPSGHIWHLATHIEDVTPEEMDRRAEKFSEQSMSKKVSGS